MVDGVLAFLRVISKQGDRQREAIEPFLTRIIIGAFWARISFLIPRRAFLLKTFTPPILHSAVLWNPTVLAQARSCDHPKSR